MDDSSTSFSVIYKYYKIEAYFKKIGIYFWK